tara:strand:- start:219 stop:470 length:252 start_codon:yes stop_codon:yes gene_type:complete
MKVYALIHNTRDTSVTLEDRVYSSVLKICDSMETAKKEQSVAERVLCNHKHYCPELEWFEIKEFTLTTRYKGNGNILNGEKEY